jgi:antitoxin MazE
MQKPTKSIELKIVPIGNSRGVRLPKEILERYAIKETLVLEPRDEGLLLPRKADLSLS